jgi:hypothetical protein
MSRIALAALLLLPVASRKQRAGSSLNSPDCMRLIQVEGRHRSDARGPVMACNDGSLDRERQSAGADHGLSADGR